MPKEVATQRCAADKKELVVWLGLQAWVKGDWVCPVFTARLLQYMFIPSEWGIPAPIPWKLNKVLGFRVSKNDT